VIPTARAGVAFIIGLALVRPLRADDLGLKVAPGFRVSLYADETIANDIYAMTLDASGRVAVTTQGDIRILHDDNGDDRADRAEVFARTATGGMGMCFDGNELWFCGDGWLSRYRDADGDGRADGPPQHIVPLQFAEHGGHAMRRGPDGFWYVIGGNDSGISRRHITAANSPVRDPQAGGMLRLSPDGLSSEVIAHGFRNPYDFDFNPSGDLFTYDSDVERDYFLPWYTPTRLFHVAHGGNHGWRLTGFLRSWSRLPYFLDAVDVLDPVGRGSPTGVACYRHSRFPERYRGGLFVLDWTFGKVYFFPLDAHGATYRTRAEVFIEPTGTQGFDPTDVVVTPDGALLISIGGRKTRGAVYRVEPLERTGAAASSSERDAVLLAPQPLDAWSRARWIPLARKLGREPFAAAVRDESLGAPARVRAVEVLTELFGGLPVDAVGAASRSESTEVRARVAWSLGRVSAVDGLSILGALAQDRTPVVRRAALDALLDRQNDAPADVVRAAIVANLGRPDKRVRQAAARLAARLGDDAWRAILRPDSDRGRLTHALAAAWRNDLGAALDAAVETLKSRPSDQTALDAARLIELVLGDYNLASPPVEVFTGYSPAREVATETRVRVLQAVRPVFPSGNADVDTELSRLLAMLVDDDPAMLERVASRWTDSSTATADFHYLVVFARLAGPRVTDQARRGAAVLLGLDGKLRGQEQRSKQTWTERLAELVAQLTRRDDRLAEALLDSPLFVKPAHVALAAVLDPAHRRTAARRFADAVKNDPDFEWSGPLVGLWSDLPADEARPLWRSHADDPGLRDAIVLKLVEPPEPVDRARFLAGLDSVQPQVVAACLTALGRLPVDHSAQQLVPLLELLRRLEGEPRSAGLRAQTLAMLERQSGQSWLIKEDANAPAALRHAYAPVFEWFRSQHPELARALDADEDGGLAAWDAVRGRIDWSAGAAATGERVFRARACHTCHTGSSRIGPDLAGVAARFARDDLFAAIVAPNSDVAPPYRVTLVETRNGRVIAGIVVFESADGLIVQTGASETVRIAAADIASRQPGKRSLMPAGLLNDLSPGDYADLYAYLRTLGASRAATDELPKAR
jgi:putative membrane-bound dehydrogenase-like protein